MKLPLLIYCLVLFTAASLCAAQSNSPPTQSDSLLRIANRYLARGSTDSARTLFSEVVASMSHATEARLGLVQVDMAEKNWWNAGQRCDTVLKKDPHNIEAHYFGGISEREWGAETAGILRLVAWSKSTDHFEAVLAKDSMYRDALYQFALLKEYKEDLPEAIALASRQVVLRPEQVSSQLGLVHIYRHYLANSDADEALPWLLDQRNDYGRFFAAEVKRRTKQYMDAETTFIDLLRKPSGLPVQGCYLSLAHMYASVNNTMRAQFCYWKAVDSIASWLGAALVFEELKYIITDKELEQYRSLASDRQKITFFHRFWGARDPMPATAINYRLIEHLQRYAQAEEQFEYYGLRTRFSNPDRTEMLRLPDAFFLNREFNDLGMIFLRQGPPNKIEQTIGKINWTPNDPMRLRQDDDEESLEEGFNRLGSGKLFKTHENANTYGPTAIDPHQSWLYFATGEEPQRIFHFALHNTTSQNWRLTPLPGDADNLDKEMLEYLAMYDARYDKLIRKGGELEFTSTVAEMQLAEKEVVTTALTTDRHVWSNGIKEISIPHAIDAFRNASSGTLLDISYAIPYAPLRAAAGPTAKKVLVEVGLLTTSSGGTRPIDTKRDTLDLLLTPDGSGHYISLFRQVLVADSVRLSAHVRALNTSAVGTWVEGLHVPSFAGKDFMLSDLQLLLPATYGPLIEIDGVKVQQSPFKSYSRARPLYAYLQVYNLVKDMTGAAGYSAQFTLAPRGDPEDATVLAEVKRDLADENSRSEFQMLDIKTINPGKYVLTVTVTDKKRVQTVSRSREIEITR